MKFIYILFYLGLASVSAQKKLATVLASSGNLNCNENAELDIWMAGDCNTSQIYQLNGSSWKTDDLTVLSELDVQGNINVDGVASVKSLNLGNAVGASNGDLKISGSLILDTQFGVVPSIQIRNTAGEIKATFGILGIWADSISATVGIHSQGIASIEGKLTVNSGDSTLVGPVYIQGGKWDLAAINPTDPSQSGLYVNWIGNTMVTPNVPGGAAQTLTNMTEHTGEFSQDQLNPTISLYTTHAIYSANVVAASDRRIKKDIEPLPDDAALTILRKLDPKYYHYKDTIQRGHQRTIGFIAQDVREVLPEAVTIVKDFIPGEMRIVDVTWSEDGKVMRLPEAIRPGVYRFYVSNEVNGSDETVYEWVTYDGEVFETPKMFANVFLYGRQVGDFHTIDKQKIFAVAYAAAQQIDKNQQAMAAKLDALEERDLSRIAQLEETIIRHGERIAELENALDAA
tara:strand:+ start:11983 stop:13353 length:1371 start_codon:yes stop_codon:yes gene_type:complete